MDAPRGGRRGRPTRARAARSARLGARQASGCAGRGGPTTGRAFAGGSEGEES